MTKAATIGLLAGGAILISALVIMFIIFRYGFYTYGIKKWEKGSVPASASWNDLFNQGLEMEVLPLSCGVSVAEPGSRPFLNPETYPEGFDINVELSAPVMAFAVRHPVHGDILFDSGLNGTFAHSDFGDLSSIIRSYQKKNRYGYELAEEQSLGYQLAALNIQPSAVFLTHMHPDHTAGLTEVENNTTLIFGAGENTFYYRMINGNYLRHLSDIRTLDFSRGKELAPFSRVLDVFGDGSILAISSPGHTTDHISYLINSKNRPVLIVGDLSMNEEYLEQGIEISADGKNGTEKLRQSLEEFRQFREMHPRVEILYSHMD